jgi:SAM-dependent methyltransferase
VGDVEWRRYLSAFHSERAGITEDVLERARDTSGASAYDWAAGPVRHGAVLDVACGSAPMAARLTGRPYLGLDVSPDELAVASARHVPVALADATRLPLADDSVHAVVISMALMLVPLRQTLGEARRVLRPGGVLVATVPTSRPMPYRDWLRYARLCLALRHRGLRYPNDDELAHAPAAFAAAGMTLEQDEARAFRCELADVHVAEQLLASLYLPDVSPERMAAGKRVVHRWVGSTLTTPIRRLVARR